MPHPDVTEQIAELRSLLEPGSAAGGTLIELAATSIAISLKRLADVAERQQRTTIPPYVTKSDEAVNTNGASVLASPTPALGKTALRGDVANRPTSRPR